ncbi:MAG: ROK family protein [Chloroflexi bacterium]|nr:ROK family protein [Chloroflexota bacterium]MBM3174191.1 ROK family protein [Chloroflexota bacterium]MBM4450187.1 ROK family protein [Chloroflexota bacterium]
MREEMKQVSQRPVLAVDLGGTKIVAAVVTPTGKILPRSSCLTLADKGPAAVIDRLISVAGSAVDRAKLKTADLDGVAIAAAGILDTARGVVTTSPNLPGWRNVHLRDIVAERLNVATCLVNDASVAALGEHRFGVGKGLANLIYLTVSTGIGGGIIVDGKLYEGTDGCAGELGHMVIDAQGPKCNCGNYGCLEVLASGTAMAKEAVSRIRNGGASLMVQLVGGVLDDITAETVATAAREGDLLACQVVNQCAAYLGVGLANLVNIFNPQLIIIGGGVSRMGGMLLRPARKVVKEKAFRLPARTVQIVKSRLGYDAGILGAAAYVHEQKLKETTR